MTQNPTQHLIHSTAEIFQPKTEEEEEEKASLVGEMSFIGRLKRQAVVYVGVA